MLMQVKYSRDLSIYIKICCLVIDDKVDDGKMSGMSTSGFIAVDYIRIKLATDTLAPDSVSKTKRIASLYRLLSLESLTPHLGYLRLPRRAYFAKPAPSVYKHLSIHHSLNRQILVKAA